MPAVGGFCTLPSSLGLPLQCTRALTACQVAKLLGGSVLLHACNTLLQPCSHRQSSRTLPESLGRCEGLAHGAASAEHVQRTM